MGMDTLVTLGLSLVEAENQRITKCPRISSLKVTHCVEAIKKIREHGYTAWKLWLEYLLNWDQGPNPYQKPFDPQLLFERLGWK